MADEISNIEVTSSEEIIVVREFSNEKLHKPGNAVYCLHNWKLLFQLQIFANGYNHESKGQVWIFLIIFENFLPLFIQQNDICLILSAMDVNGSKRYPKTFILPQPGAGYGELRKDYPTAVIQPAKQRYQEVFLHYISRETLLQEPFDLLADDIFKLHIYSEYRSFYTDIYEGHHFDTSVEHLVDCSFQTESESGKKHFLLLKSKVVEKLEQESEYFKRMVNTEMIEKETNRMYLPGNEYHSLWIICCIRMGARNIQIDSIQAICQIYTVGHKYGISTALNSCRDFLICIYSCKDHPFIKFHIEVGLSYLKALASIYDDAHLNQIIEEFQIIEDHNAGNIAHNQISENAVVTEWKLDLEESIRFTLLHFRRHYDQRRYNFYT